MTLSNLTHRIVLLVAGVALTSCSNLATSSETQANNTDNSAKVSQEAPSKEQSIAKESLTGETFFQLFLGEIATNRREMGAAAALYGQVANTHNDVEAINRAVVLNQSIGDYESMHQLTSRWINLRPTDETALQAHSLSSIATGRLDEGEAALESLLTNNDNADVSIILSAVEVLEPTQREQLRTMLSTLTNRHPSSASLLYTQARIEAPVNPERALSLAEASSNLEEHVETSLLRFQILLNLERIADAEALIADLDDQYSEEPIVARQYARFLYQHKTDNLDKLSELHTRFSNDPIVSRTYAQAAFDQNQYDQAEAVFLRLANTQLRDEALYFLGQIYVASDRLDEAANQFESISSPPYLISGLSDWARLKRADDEQRFVAAIEKAANIQPDRDSVLRRIKASFYQNIGKLEQAELIFEDALSVYPNNTAVLYDAAMLDARLNRFNDMETKLERIIELDANNINALNALGYTWADQNRNLEKALSYINRALEAEPDNPAFQDSKGWVVFRQGNPKEALVWLEKAYSSLVNDEIAAHIAEVLWALNRDDEARSFLQQVELLDPKSRYIDHLNQLFEQRP